MGVRGNVYAVHLRLIGELVVDFPLVITFFARCFCFVTIHAFDRRTDRQWLIGRPRLHSCSTVVPELLYLSYVSVSRKLKIDTVCSVPATIVASPYDLRQSPATAMRRIASVSECRVTISDVVLSPTVYSSRTRVYIFKDSDSNSSPQNSDSAHYRPMILSHINSCIETACLRKSSGRLDF